MKNIIALAAFLLLATTFSFAQKTYTSLEIGKEIPMAGMKMTTADGKTISLEDSKMENGLLVMFSCNTCPYVVKSEQRTQEIMRFAKTHEIGMVILNSNEDYRDEQDSPSAMRNYAKKQGYNVPYLMDEKSTVADAFGATRTPEVFLFNSKGILVYKGAMEDNPTNPAESKSLFLKAAMENMIAGKEINPTATKSIGCSIKRSL